MFMPSVNKISQRAWPFLMDILPLCHFTVTNFNSLGPQAPLPTQKTPAHAVCGGFG